MAVINTLRDFLQTKIVNPICKLRSYDIDYKIDMQKIDSELFNLYIPLEYIETDCLNYLDTGYNANTETTRVVAKIKFLNSPAVVVGIFGNRDSSEPTKNCSILMNRGQLRLDWVGNTGTYAKIEDGIIYTIDCSGNSVKVNDTLYGGTVAKQNITFTDTLIFGRASDQRGATNKNTLIYNGTVQAIYSIKIYEKDELVRDLYPCACKNKLGMWDKINHIFYPLITN